MSRKTDPEFPASISPWLAFSIKLESFCYNAAIASGLLGAALLLAQEFDLVARTAANMVFVKLAFAFGILQLLGQRALIIVIRRELAKGASRPKNKTEE